MNKNKKLVIGIFLLVSVLILSISVIKLTSAEGSYCCEKTTYGAYCQSESAENCDSSINSLTGETYKKAPTSCELTSFCKLGTCINNEEGTCLPNTPQRVCEQEGGYWDEKSTDELPQCQLGCCLIGDQAAFVTQTRCKALASLYGVEGDYRGDITNEVQCIASANPTAKGACVYEENNVKKCDFTTKAECQGKSPSDVTEEKTFLNSIFGGNSNSDTTTSGEVSFHEGFLCSAESLGTICGPSKETTCQDEKVYFVDTCGNTANIYDASKVNNDNYWTYITEPENSCGYDDLSGNTNSKTCGNCDYYFGSTCKSTRESNSPAPQYGDFICSSLDCTDTDFRQKYGRNPQHGERWCVTNTGENTSYNAPGTEQAVFECRDGEVGVYDECSVGDYRGVICLEDEINNFNNARCGVNQWSDCLEQEREEDCLDTEKRDCAWQEGFSVLKKDDGTEKKLENSEGNDVYASCVPKYSPAFDFWQPDTQAEAWCSVASNTGIVEMEIWALGNRKKLKDDQQGKIKHCVSNCYLLEGYKVGDAKLSYENDNTKRFKNYADWIGTMGTICSAIGDCGTSENYLGQSGYFKEGDNVESEFFVNPKDLEESQ